MDIIFSGTGGKTRKARKKGEMCYFYDAWVIVSSEAARGDGTKTKAFLRIVAGSIILVCPLACLLATVADFRAGSSSRSLFRDLV